MGSIRRGLIRTFGAAALAAGVAVGAAGCGQSEPNVRVADTEARGDGVLKFGLLLESTGEQKFLNDSQRAAVALAIQEINDAGGLKGRPVELLPSQAGEAAAVAAQDFIDGGADVVIGPTDSAHAPAVIDLLSEAGVVIISPANGAAALSGYSSGGYYFRTYPSNLLESRALADQLQRADKQNVVILHGDSTYGRSVSDALGAELSAGEGSPQLVSLADGIPGAVSEARSADPDAVVVVARQTARAVIGRLAETGIEPAKLYLGSGATGDYGDALAVEGIEGAHGIHAGSLASPEFAQRMLTMDPGLDHLTFAAEAYDAVMLAALAAAEAKDDAGASVASHLLAVSGNTGADAADSGVTACSAFAECIALLRGGKTIDYEGQSGPVTFNADGDVAEANFRLYHYGADNRPVLADTVLLEGRAAHPQD